MWPCTRRRPSVVLLVLYTLVALTVTGFLVLCEVALWYGYILPNDAVLGWPSTECVVNMSSFEVQTRVRCIADNQCWRVTRAYVRVRTLGPAPRELLAFDTVFGDFARGDHQSVRFVSLYNRTANADSGGGGGAARGGKGSSPPAPLASVYTATCYLNPLWDEPVCIDPKAELVVVLRGGAAMHGGPCVGRAVLGSPAAYVTDFTSRGMAAHRLVWTVGLVFGSASAVLVYCMCLGWALRCGRRRCTHVLRPPVCLRACGCCPCCDMTHVKLPADMHTLDDSLHIRRRSSFSTAHENAQGGGGSDGSYAPSLGDVVSEPRSSPRPRPEPKVVALHSLQRSGAPSSSPAGSGRNSSRSGSQASSRRAADDGAAGSHVAGAPGAERQAAGSESEPERELSQKARIPRSASSQSSSGRGTRPKPRFVIYSPSQAAASGLVELTSGAERGAPTMRLVGSQGAGQCVGLPSSQRGAARATIPAARRPRPAAEPAAAPWLATYPGADAPPPSML
jgi:hypothetical protein